MSNWLTEHMALLLTEDGKLAEILASLTFFQCITFFLILFLMAKLSGKTDKEIK